MSQKEEEQNESNRINYWPIKLTEIDEYIAKMKDMQIKILEYLDAYNNLEEKYQQLLQHLEDHKIKDHKYNVIDFLQLISKIAKHHQRQPNFFSKIEKFLNLFEEEIKKYITSEDLFNIFKDDKRILLYLFEKKIIFITKNIASTLLDWEYVRLNYCGYFTKELRSYEKLSHNILSEIIRNDSIEEFIVYINKNDLNLNSMVDITYFETNPFLFKNHGEYACLTYKTTLIEYATFFGSNQIFKYLCKNNVELTPSLWLYAVHGRDPEIFNILTENKIKPKDETFVRCLKEAIKCHHNEVANYILDNLISNEIKESINVTELGIKYHNFSFIETLDSSLFGDLCFNNYPILVNLFVKKTNVDVNEKFLIKGKRRKRHMSADARNTYFIDEHKTPLYLSILNQNIEIVKILLNCENIDVNASSKIRGKNYCDDFRYLYNETPLCLATKKNLIEIVKVLLTNNKFDINLTSQIDDYDNDDTQLMSCG